MGVTVGVNGMSVVHKDSGGVSLAPVDVCKAPPPVVPGPPFIPLPLPNVAKSQDLVKGTKKVKCDGQSVAIDGSAFNPSTGDEAGSQGGMISGKTKGKAELVTFSGDVRFEGKGVGRALDMMTHNDGNTPPAPILQGPLLVPVNEEDSKCPVCGELH